MRFPTGGSPHSTDRYPRGRVLRLLKRSGKVHVVIVPNARSDRPIPIIREKPGCSPETASRLTVAQVHPGLRPRSLGNSDPP